jgi:hypothetical protein
MDINDLRSIVTVAGLLCFPAIVWWAYGKGSKKGFDEAANCRSRSTMIGMRCLARRILAEKKESK